MIVVRGYLLVSTHSHPKVAAKPSAETTDILMSFNTQPPEGGCEDVDSFYPRIILFQHTATRRWLPQRLVYQYQNGAVSTHSHPKVAAATNLTTPLRPTVSTHSHPKVAAPSNRATESNPRCFNTQPPEGGCLRKKRTTATLKVVSTHSHPKVAACQPTS